MEILQDLLARLSPRHRNALEWFRRNAGTEQPWPKGIEGPEGVDFLATQAKGIYKPAWTEYALSVRQTLTSPYEEIGPIYRADGTWLYGYHQENTDPGARDLEYANRGLVLCQEDSMPVGVMRQTSRKPRVRYRILGLALVAAWDDGYFFFEGFSPEGLAHITGNWSEIELLSAEQEKAASGGHDFVVGNLLDARRRVIAQIVQRQGQHGFREKLLAAYGWQCAITGCNAVEALEAAHILSYGGPDTNHVQNGLLLRADIHTLFDLGLIAINPESMTVLLSPRLASTSYQTIEGATIRMPANPMHWPNRDALRQHLQRFVAEKSEQGQ